MPRYEPDPAVSCPSALPWKLWRADSGLEEQANIICEAFDCVVAVNVPEPQARAIVAAHNGEQPD